MAEEKSCDDDFDIIFARMMLSLYDESDIIPKSILLKVTLHYKTAQNLVNKFMESENETDKKLMIYNEVNLDFDFQSRYDWEESIKMGEMVEFSFKDFDQEIQEVNAWLKGDMFDSVDKFPSESQKKRWSMLIYQLFINDGINMN